MSKMVSFKTAAMIIFLITIVLLWYCFLSVLFQPKSYAGQLPQREIIVKAGDTLWGMSEEYGPKNEDPRVLVEEVRTLNEMSSANIYPGQVIRLPW